VGLTGLSEGYGPDAAGPVTTAVAAKRSRRSTSARLPPTHPYSRYVSQSWILKSPWIEGASGHVSR
jgi:hypothetical protein